MSKQPAIIVDNVSMKFNLSKEKVDSLKDYIIKSIKKEIKYNEFWALQIERRLYTKYYTHHCQYDQ